MIPVAGVVESQHRQLAAIRLWAMDLWGKLLAEAITGTAAPANVVPMVARAG
jgi:hypothetical protein